VGLRVRVGSGVCVGSGVKVLVGVGSSVSVGTGDAVPVGDGTSVCVEEGIKVMVGVDDIKPPPPLAWVWVWKTGRGEEVSEAVAVFDTAIVEVVVIEDVADGLESALLPKEKMGWLVVVKNS